MSDAVPYDKHKYTGDPEPMRVVQVLSCAPGVTMEVHQRPISILHLGYRGEAECPLALTLVETRRLVMGLLVSLVTHSPDDAEAIQKWYERLGEDDEGEEWKQGPPPAGQHRDDETTSDWTDLGGRFRVLPPDEESLPPSSSPHGPPQPPPAAAASKRPRRSPTPRPFACALTGCHIKVRFVGEPKYRRFGFLAAFAFADGLHLACRRLVPRPDGRGNRIDDFLLHVPSPETMKATRDRSAVYLGRHLGCQAVTDIDWRLMDATPEGGEITVNGLPMQRMKRWAGWAVMRCRIFDAGCTYEQWR